MELAIRVVSRHCRDKRLDAGRSHAGDVLDSKPDHWPWSERERTNPEWVIVRTPITQIEADALIAEEFDQFRTRPFVYRHRRKLDLKALGIRPTNEIIVMNHRSLDRFTIDKGVASAN